MVLGQILHLHQAAGVARNPDLSAAPDKEISCLCACAVNLTGEIRNSRLDPDFVAQSGSEPDIDNVGVMPVIVRFIMLFR